MSKTNAQLAHAFYYDGVDNGGYAYYKRNTCSYTGNEFRSYSTTIGVVIPAKGYERPRTNDPASGVLLASYFSMSPTTCKHISDLIHACPFSTKILVPFIYGRRMTSVSQIVEIMSEELDKCRVQFSHKEYRVRFVDMYKALVELRKHVPADLSKTITKILAKHRQNYKNCTENLAALQAKLRAKVAKQAAEKVRLTREANERFKKLGSKEKLEDLELLFGSNPFLLGPESRALRRVLDSSGFSYVWLHKPTEDTDVSNAQVRTSKGIRMDARTVGLALRMWHDGHDMHRKTVGPYTILDVGSNIIQIGCHRIPRWNLTALYEVLTGKTW